MNDTLIQTHDRRELMGMMSAEMKREAAEANRRRYEELRAAGQEATPKGLPEADRARRRADSNRRP